MNFSEEEIHQDREGPEEDIVDPVRHGIGLLMFMVLRRRVLVYLFFSHDCGYGVSKTRAPNECMKR